VRIVCIRSRFQRSDSCRSSGRRRVRGPRSSPAERAALLHPVFVISARDPEEIEKQALDAGARVVFSKPFDHEVLLRQIAGELH
jgi:CheY-like chemotaxis protein